MLRKTEDNKEIGVIYAGEGLRKGHNLYAVYGVIEGNDAISVWILNLTERIERYIFLMKSEPNYVGRQRHGWIIDESKCLVINEINRLRQFCENMKEDGLRKKKFTSVRNWFMIELGLHTGLRVEEMAGLQHKNLLIDEERSSIVVIGKGKKKRQIWISTAFKKTCLQYINYKDRFGYATDDEAYLLNNMKDTRISKRSLQKFFKSVFKKCDLSPHYYIHCLRHTYTTFLLRASNHNYRFAQQQLGHSSIRTTQVYASVIESDRREALQLLYK